MWEERVRGDLTVELRRPAAGKFRSAAGASAIRCEAIFLNEVAVTADQSLMAAGAVSIFPVSDHSWQIPWIDISQTGLSADRSGPQQVFRSCITRIIHLVVAVKRGHVPGNIGRHTSHELR